MPERKALIAYGIGIVVVEFMITGALAHLGADSETLASAYVLFTGAAAIGGGFLFMRYH